MKDNSFTSKIKLPESKHLHGYDLYAVNQHFLTYPNVHHAKLYFVGEVCLQFVLAGGAECWLENELLTFRLCRCFGDASLSWPVRCLGNTTGLHRVHRGTDKMMKS